MNCKHAQTSIVVVTHRETGEDFVTAQCDVCGHGLPNVEILPEVFEAWNAGTLPLPRVDTEAYKRAIDTAWRDIVEGEARELRVLAEVVTCA